MTHGSGSVSSRSPRAAVRESSASAVAWAISPAPSGVLAAHDMGASGFASSPSRWCSTAVTDRAPSIGARVISRMSRSYVLPGEHPPAERFQ